MTTKLNENSSAFAQDNEFIEAHGWDQYANWHLGIEDAAIRLRDLMDQNR